MSHSHDPSAPTQNSGNALGARPSVRHTRNFREKESGNAMKAILGTPHLAWDTDPRASSLHAGPDKRPGRAHSGARGDAAPRRSVAHESYGAPGPHWGFGAGAGRGHSTSSAGADYPGAAAGGTADGGYGRPMAPKLDRALGLATGAASYGAHAAGEPHHAELHPIDAVSSGAPVTAAYGHPGTSPDSLETSGGSSPARAEGGMEAASRHLQSGSQVAASSRAGGMTVATTNAADVAAAPEAHRAGRDYKPGRGGSAPSWWG